MRYLVLHSDPQGLIMSASMRDLLFATGNVVDVRECCLHSVQPEFFANVSQRPLTLVLWGMADRYGEAERAGLEVVQVDNWGDALAYCNHLWPYQETWTDSGGTVHPMTHWKQREFAEEA